MNILSNELAPHASVYTEGAAVTGLGLVDVEKATGVVVVGDSVIVGANNPAHLAIALQEDSFGCNAAATWSPTTFFYYYFCESEFMTVLIAMRYRELIICLQRGCGNTV